MPNAVKAYLGDYQFIPVPFLNIERQPYLTADGATQLGNTYNITLDGTLTPLGDIGGTGGYVSVDALQDNLDAHCQIQGQRFRIICDTNTLVDCYPKIINGPVFSKSQDNWVFTTPYSLTLQFHEILPGSGVGFIKEFSETWSLQPVEDKSFFTFNLSNGSGDASPHQFRLNHQISCVGLSHFTATGAMPAWKRARSYVISQLGYDSGIVSASGVINLNTANFVGLNHQRSEVIDQTAGSFNVTEDFYVINPSGAGTIGNAYEDFTTTVTNGTQSNLTTISIEGTIQGLETKSYGTNPNDFTITESAYSAASGAFNIVRTRLYERAKLFGDQTATRAINVVPTNMVVGHSPSRGSISYSTEFTDKPALCIPGALTENITFTSNYITDVVAQIPVLGRAQGPVLQFITSSASTAELNIEIVMAPPTGCIIGQSPSYVLNYINQSGFVSVNGYVTSVEDYLESIYSQVFKITDTDNFNTGGSYSRSVIWLVQNC